MSGGGTSLLPHVNPSDAPIQPVQGGGAYKTINELSGRAKAPGWHSTPLIIPVATNNEGPKVSKMKMQSYVEKWKRTLGTNIPNRNVPSGDVAVVVGSLNILECPTYVVAPLRGDLDAATDAIMWANTLLKEDTRAHVVFMGPHTEGGSREDGMMIEKMLEALTASYPGHALRVGDHSMEAGSLDGLVIHAMPHTSKQVILGYIPDPDDELDSSVRELDCLEIETIRIPSDAKGRHHTGARMFSVNFSKATSSYNRDKQPRPQIIKENRRWNAPPGWVTQITFHKRGLSVQMGGADTPAGKLPGANPPAKPPVLGMKEVILNNKIYMVRDPNQAITAWKMGSFNEAEKKMLEENNLKFTNEVYAIFLKGLVDHNCTIDPSAKLSPECAIFRYLDLKAHLDGQYDKMVGAVPSIGKKAAPAVTSPAVTSPAVTSPAVTSPAVTSPPVTSPPVTSPAANPAPTMKSTATSPMAPIENTGSPTNPDEEKVVADRIRRGIEDAKKYEAQKAANEAAKEATKGEGQKAVTKRLQEAKGEAPKNNTKKNRSVAEGEAPATPKNNTKKKPNAGLARVAAAEGKAPNGKAPNGKAPATPKNNTKKKPNAGLARVAAAEGKAPNGKAPNGKAPATPKNNTKKKPNAGLARVAAAEKKVGFK